MPVLVREILGFLIVPQKLIHQPLINIKETFQQMQWLPRKPENLNPTPQNICFTKGNAGLVVYAYNLSTGEAERGRSLRIISQSD